MFLVTNTLANFGKTSETKRNSLITSTPGWKLSLHLHLAPQGVNSIKLHFFFTDAPGK
jgi:hypothetical protein